MSTQTKLRSNGFGRVEQQIVFSIQERHATRLSDDLNVLPYNDTHRRRSSYYIGGDNSKLFRCPNKKP